MLLNSVIGEYFMCFLWHPGAGPSGGSHLPSPCAGCQWGWSWLAVPAHWASHSSDPTRSAIMAQPIQRWNSKVISPGLQLAAPFKSTNLSALLILLQLFMFFHTHAYIPYNNIQAPEASRLEWTKMVPYFWVMMRTWMTRLSSFGRKTTRSPLIPAGLVKKAKQTGTAV